MTDFKAADTETINRPGHGEACMLIKQAGASQQILEFPADFRAIFDFFAGGSWVFWNMDFDARAILHPRYLPWEVVERLGLYGWASWGSFKFRYVPRKFVSVSDGARKFEFYDLMQFYDSSLETASQKFLGEGKAEIPAAWYSKIDLLLKAGGFPAAKIREYAARDVALTQRHLDHLLTSCANLGLSPQRLTSAASLAKLKFGPILAKQAPSVSENLIFQKAFYGGRIETRLLGRLPWPVEAFDIHSAYPAEFAKLPTTRGVAQARNYSSGPAWRDQKPYYGAYKIFVSVPRSWLWGPFAVRQGNRIYYPTGQFETWVSRPGLEVCQKYGLPFRVLYSAEIWPESLTPIFDDLPALYAARKDPSVSLALKKVINSLYGVTAEQTTGRSEAPDFSGARLGARYVRRFSRFGKYTNFAMAAHCTESVRMKIWECLHRLGSDAVFCATDGILVRAGAQFPSADIGPALGQWGSEKIFCCGVVLGSGRYRLHGADGSDLRHLRGFSPSTANFSKLGQSRARSCRLVSLEAASMYEWASMLADEANVLQDFARKFEIEDDKRYWPGGFFRRISDAFHETRESLPLIFGNPRAAKKSPLPSLT